MSKFVDLTGKRFGRLTVIKRKKRTIPIEHIGYANVIAEIQKP